MESASPAVTQGSFTAARHLIGGLILLALCTAAIIAVLVAAYFFSIANLRSNFIAAAEGNLTRRSLTLAEQADRAIQTVDFLLGTLAADLERSGVVDSASYTEKVGNRETHVQLRDKIKAIPQIDAVTMVNRDGKLINFTRRWPIPDVDVSYRDYYRALSATDAPTTFISGPEQIHSDGSWNFFLARRVNGPNGEFAGMILGAMATSYFEDFYRAILQTPGNGVGLYRSDGTPLVRYQNGDLALTGLPDPSVPADVTAADPVTATLRLIRSDGAGSRIVAVRKLRNYPLLVICAQTEDSALVGMRDINRIAMMRLIGGITLVLFAAGAIGLWFRTHHRAAAAELARAAAEAELLRHQERTADVQNQAKSAFLATMSHEIRTPMNALLGLASSLLESRLNSEQREDVLAMQRAGADLLRILNDILDFSKLEAGKFRFETAPFSPAAVTDHAVSIIAPRAKEKHLLLRTANVAELPETLVGDQGRIRQILLNLLSNAIKFTERGEVSVTIDVLARDEQSATLRWSVRDTGIGIADGKLATLFSEFVQADGSINRRFGETGLGLAICRRIIEQMNGTIRVESEPGRGSTFQFELTLPISAKAMKETRASPAAVVDLHNAIAGLGRPAAILLAEDNATNQMVAIRMLKEFDCRVDVASDGRQAVEAAGRTDYDVIVMDVCMPEMDGHAAARAIRQNGGRGARVPIIAMTANAFEDDVAACRAAGMDDFLAKPTSKRALVEAILRALAASPIPAAATVAESAPQDEAFDPATYEALCDAIGDSGASETLSVFLRDTAARIGRLLGLACTDPDVRGEAHALKSAAAALGFLRLAGHAKALEKSAKEGLTADELACSLQRIEAAFEAGRSAAAAELGPGTRPARAA